MGISSIICLWWIDFSLSLSPLMTRLWHSVFQPETQPNVSIKCMQRRPVWWVSWRTFSEPIAADERVEPHCHLPRHQHTVIYRHTDRLTQSDTLSHKQTDTHTHTHKLTNAALSWWARGWNLSVIFHVISILRPKTNRQTDCHTHRHRLRPKQRDK